MAKHTGSYHLASNPQLYEIQRQNTFEFIVTDIDGILRAGATGTEANARIANAQEVLRVSVSSAPVPFFTQETITLRRGNSVMKFAGLPTFNEGQITLDDFIGADTKSILLAWQNLSYNVSAESVGSLDVTNYKKNCYLIEYTPDYRPVRTWVLYGCFISGLSEGDYNQEQGGKQQITATIQYDHAEIDMSSFGA